MEVKHQESMGNNYYLGCGLSARNTTVSDKNSDPERITKIDNKAAVYYLHKNDQEGNQASDKLKRGRSADNRRGRESRNLERKDRKDSQPKNK
mmetsp:Transcript_10956/g.9688  ORF Transcript_10956/g.9688 Transcript_10956/m.9688 type:complete len:93 (+) Transcript_10956:150-428(+)